MTSKRNSATAAETPLPTGVELTPFDEAFRNDPYPVLKRLRDAEPIHRDHALSRWFVTGFDNAREVLRNKDLSNGRGGSRQGSQELRPAGVSLVPSPITPIACRRREPRVGLGRAMLAHDLVLSKNSSGSHCRQDQEKPCILRARSTLDPPPLIPAGRFPSPPIPWAYPSF